MSNRKSEINKRVQARYDELRAAGKHGHYETMFRVVHETLAAALPPDPAPDEVSLAVGLAVHDVHEFPAKTYLARAGQAARRALRASLLLGEEPS